MKKRWIGIAAAVLLVLGAAAAVWAAAGRRPLRDLDIARATVCLTPPDKTLQVADTEALAVLLDAVVVYRRDDSYTECAGQGVTYTLTLRDGTERTVMAYNPFVVIDGVGYQTEYAPCEALNAYANGLLREDAPRLWPSPPGLDVVSDQTCVESLPGAFSWEADQGDGAWRAAMTDCAHPLEPFYRDQLAPLETPEATAQLRFQEPPQSVTVRAWPIEAVGHTAAAAEAVTVRDLEIDLQAGSWLYEATAEWDAEAYRGTASYIFWIEASPA